MWDLAHISGIVKMAAGNLFPSAASRSFSAAASCSFSAAASRSFSAWNCGDNSVYTAVIEEG